MNIRCEHYDVNKQAQNYHTDIILETSSNFPKTHRIR